MDLGLVQHLQREWSIISIKAITHNLFIGRNFLNHWKCNNGQLLQRRLQHNSVTGEVLQCRAINSALYMNTDMNMI